MLKNLFQMFLILTAMFLITSCSANNGGSDPQITPLPPPPEPPIELMVCLEWDHVVHPDLAGYTMYYGKVSEQYDVEVDIGEEDNAVCIVDDSYFVEGACYYFAVTAFSDYDDESDYSNEVFWCPAVPENP